MNSYGDLCTEFYDLDKPTAPELALEWYGAALAGALEESPGRVLEPMCGSGRFLVPLLKRGLLVDGVDPSEPMLKACRARVADAYFAVESPWGTWDPANAEDRAVAAAPLPRIRLWQQTLEQLDLREPEPDVPPDVVVARPEFEPYGAAFIPASSFCLIIDREKALEGLRRLRSHLAPGAPVLIEFELPHPSVNWPGETVRTVTDGGRQIRLESRVAYDSRTQLETYTNVYELKQSGRVVQTENEILRLRCYAPDEIRSLLESAGFEDITIEHPEFGWVACARS